jgi:predicted transcriptional regulator
MINRYPNSYNQQYSIGGDFMKVIRWKFKGSEYVSEEALKKLYGSPHITNNMRNNSVPLKKKIETCGFTVEELYSKYGNVYKMSKFFDVNSKQLTKALCELGYGEKLRELNMSVKEIIETYNKSIIEVFIENDGNVKNIASVYGVSPCSVHNYLTSNNIQYKVVKYILNKDNLTYTELNSKMNNDLKMISKYFHMSPLSFRKLSESYNLYV